MTTNDDQPNPAETDTERFDRIARGAATSLRRDAPSEGANAIAKAADRRRASRVAIAAGAGVLALVAAVVFAARGNDDGENQVPAASSTVTTAGGTNATAAPTPTSAASTTINPTTVPTTVEPSTTVPEGQLAPELHQRLADYVGGSDAAPTGEPIVIGLYKPDVFTDLPATIVADYVNEHFGGAAGRPVEIELCASAAVECADQFASGRATVVFEGTFGETFGTELDGRLPLVAAALGDPASVSLHPGMFDSLTAQAIMIAQQLADDPTPKVATNLLGFDDVFLGVLHSLLPTVEVVGLPGVTVSDIQSANATDADVFVLNTVYAGCTSLAASLAQLDIAPTVYANVCNPIDGWYQTDLGFDPTDPDLESGALPMTTLLEEGGYSFRDQDAMLLGTRNASTILTLVQQINELGPSVTPQTLDAALRTRTRPVMFGFGELDCTLEAVTSGRRSAGSCIQFVDVWRGEADGTWAFDRVLDLRTS